MDIFDKRFISPTKIQKKKVEQTDKEFTYIYMYIYYVYVHNQRAEYNFVLIFYIL